MAPVALITGAAGQLGRAVSMRFAASGHRLILVDRDTSALQPLLGSALRSDAVELAAADLLQVEQVQAAVAAGLARFGRIDILCHLAGGFRMGPAVHETPPGDWQFLMDLNAGSLLNVARAVIPAMIRQGGGRVVTVGAGAAQRGGAQMGAYAASKSSLMRLTESMSAELKDRNINVNCVLPSIIDTPDNRAAMPDADASRWVSPAALAEVIAFLCSDAASAVHGAALPVSGRV
ncbi:MAG: SDR family oxidoreductase [Burkholderiaceae bacterium]